jgi:dTDP-glucose 4,6-dehydratase
MMQALRGEPLTVYGDGSQTRSFCYVSDLIDGIVRLAKSGEHDPVNIGNPVEWTILECAQEIQALIGSHCVIEFRPLPQDDPTRRRPDITRAKALLGWEPKVALRDGLERSLEYFRAANARG